MEKLEAQRMSKLEPKLLAEWLERSVHESLKYYRTPELVDRLARFVEKMFRDCELSDTNLSELKNIMSECDIRSLADYWRILKKPNGVEDAFNNLSASELGLARYEALKSNGESKVCLEVETVTELFDDNLPVDSQLINLNKYGDLAVAKELQEFLTKIEGNFTQFYKAQFDLPGINSLVRRGLVKDLYLESGTRLVIKRDNPDKANRFRTEQENIAVLSEKLELKRAFDCREIDKLSDGRRLDIQLVRPIAVLSDKQNKVFYSFMPFYEGQTLEEVLRSLKDDEQEPYLEAVNKLLEFLYSQGVEWGDFAPRNILVSKSNESELLLTILDFEKTRLMDSPMSFEEKVEHCRGPMCVEEFGALCDLKKLKSTFDPYFNPDSWDTETTDPVPFKKPKRELKAIFEARKLSNPNLGDYNRLEKDVLGVRLPVELENGERLYPLEANFKIDHYFGPDYDRKLTEIFLYANSEGNLDKVIELVNRGNRIVDDQMFLVDLQKLFPRSAPQIFADDRQEKGLLLSLVDDLEKARIDGVAFEPVIERYKRAFELYDKLKINGENIEGLEIANFIAADARTRVRNFLGSTKLAVDFVLGGGFARGEATWRSDADLLPIGNDLSCLPEFCRDFMQSTGLEVELYPLSTLAYLQNNFRKYPHLFLDLVDFDFSTLANKQLAEMLVIWRDQLLQDTEFVASALNFRILANQTKRVNIGKVEELQVKDLKVILRDTQFLQFLFESGFIDLGNDDAVVFSGLRSDLLKVKAFRELVPTGKFSLKIDAENLQSNLAKFYEVFDEYSCGFIVENLSSRQLKIMNAELDEINEVVGCLDNCDSCELLILKGKKNLPMEIKQRLDQLIQGGDWLADLRD